MVEKPAMRIASFPPRCQHPPSDSLGKVGKLGGKGKGGAERKVQFSTYTVLSPLGNFHLFVEV